jgi:penicillin-binding protein 1B
VKRIELEKLKNYLMERKLYVALLSSLFLFFMFVGYLVYISFHVKSIMLGESGRQEVKIYKGESLIEQDSYFRMDDLSFYLNFTNLDKNSEDWIMEKMEKFDEVGNGIMLAKYDLKLPELLKNDCKRIYCFKHAESFSNIPSSLWKALIGIEDIRFLHHSGVDLKSILRAIIVDIKEMRLAQGGSTITQQLVKNLFFSNERSFVRKIKEAIYSIYIETQFDKDQILEAYFNEVFWGSLQGIQIKGFYAASLFYFQKKPQFLSDYETSILVSMLKGPYFYSPILHPDRLRKRADYVYQKLLEEKFIARSPGVKWGDARWSIWLKRLKSFDAKKYYRAFWRVEYAPINMMTPFEEFTFNSGVYNVVRLLKERIGSEDVAIKAYVAEANCDGNCEDYFSYYTKVERDKVVAIEKEKHQVGSILKPIFYQIMKNNGKKWNDLVSTKPITLNLLSGDWTPRDSSSEKREEITVLEALRKSRNIPLVRMASQIGFEKIENEAILYVPQLKTPLGEYPSQMLGAVELSVKDVFDTYKQYIQTECMKMNDGEYSFNESIMHYLSDHSETTIRRVVNKTLKDVQFFGKTGTTNNGLDNWYVAYDGKWIYAIWFGLEGSREEKKLRLSGAWSSFQIFQYFMNFRGKRFPILQCPMEEGNL